MTRPCWLDSMNSAMTDDTLIRRRSHPAAARPFARRGSGKGRLIRRQDLRPDTADAAARRPTILLAYAGRPERSLLTALLMRHGYDITPCDNGQEALQRLHKTPFDLVVTGLMMPHVDGLELLRSLRRRRGVPPVVVVAEAGNPLEQVYLRLASLLGAASTHAFPVNPAPLLTSLHWLLDPAGTVPDGMV